MEKLTLTLSEPGDEGLHVCFEIDPVDFDTAEAFEKVAAQLRQAMIRGRLRRAKL